MPSLLQNVMTCDYCKGVIADGERNCANCGAPVEAGAAGERNYRACPFCHRKLLALGSPACSYCGRRLPDDYIKSREADLQRVSELGRGSEISEVGRKVDELIRQTARSQRGSSLSVLDITNLTDLFS